MESFKPPAQIELNTGNVCEKWRKWKAQFLIYFEACELDKKSKTVQRGILLHAAGPEAQEVAETFTWTAGEDKEDYKKWLEKFDTYVQPRKNVVYERYQFWSRNQNDSESIDTWVTDLRLAAKRCEFGDQEMSLIRDKVVFGIINTAVKERLLREPDLSLQKALEICRAAEASKSQVRAMTHAQSAQPEVNIVRHFRPRQAHGKSSSKSQKHSSSGNAPVSSDFVHSCRYCGDSHARGRCPAYGKICSVCGGRNHFAAVCQGGGHRRNMSSHSNNVNKKSYSKNSNKPNQQNRKFVRTIDEDTDIEVDSVMFIGALTMNGNDKWQETLLVGDSKSKCRFKLDTGADANVLPKAIVVQMNELRNVKPSKQPLRAFGGSKIMPVGVIDLQTVCPRTNISCLTSFYVTQTADIPILGKHACEQFGLVQRIFALEPDDNVNVLTKQCLLDTYADVFTGLGQFAEPYKITVDPEVSPVVQRARRVPYAKLPALKSALEKLEKAGVVAPVNRPTDWVNNLVITEKKDASLRICLDPKPLNVAIKRERHIIPTADDVQAQLSGKKIFSVIDMKDCYWQVVLNDDSSYLCTFHTPWGRKRFLRMPFGISSASEVMQKRNESTFADIHGVYVIADDLIIAASDHAEHDKIMRSVMLRAREKNVRFNKNKLQFKTDKVMYMGNIVSADGLQADPSKISAIINMPVPDNKQALQRLLGMIRYLAQFIPHESSITAPLRSLLKKDSHWHWGPEHDKAVSDIKQAIAQPTLLHFFDVKKSVVVQSDASQTGLGACILQDSRPIAFASRALTSAEENYSQIEKELLAITFACAKFHQYVYGREVTVHTDHKPLETIFKKPLAKAAPRLQRMLLQLQRYTLQVNYVPGKLMYVADTLSRAYVQGDPSCGAPDDIEVMVHMLLDSLPMTEAKRKQFKDATASDRVMCQLMKTVANGWPKSRKVVIADLRPNWNIRDQLHIAEGLLFNGEQIVVPKSLQAEMLCIIHESHLGVQKCKARAREVVFWPNMLADIEATVSKCEICAALRPDQPKEPLMPHQVPDRPWQKLAADIMTLQGKDYLVVMDYHSKYPELALLERKTASCVILHLKSIMARHGIPEQLCTDNVPFNSAEFRKFANEWNFTLITSSPNYPQSNGQAEKAVHILKQLLTKAILSGRDPYIALLEYRNTPVCGLPFSPAQMLMSRRLRSKLPATANHLQPAVVHAKPMLQEQQRKQKKYYDRGARHLKPLKPGDSVHIRHGKLWKPAVIVKRHLHPRSYIVSCDGAQYRRNRRHILHTPGISPPVDHQYDQRYFMDDEFVTPCAVPPEPNIPVQQAQIPQIPIPPPAIVPEEGENIPVQVERRTSNCQKNSPSYLSDYVRK